MWNMLQCAVQGRGHIKADIPCQDKTCVYEKDGVSVIALADGAGSAKLSHYGAESVTEFICRYMAEGFWNYYNEPDGAAFKRKLLNDLDDNLEALSEYHHCEKKDLSSTLLVAAVCEENYILLHIGDGVIGYLKEGELKVASQPENGEFVNTTVFTTSKDALQTMKLFKGKLGMIEGFVLMSDGSEAALFHKRNKTLAPALKRVMELSQILDLGDLELQLQDNFETVIRNATTDDCSLAVLMKEKEGFRGYRFMTRDEKENLFGITNENFSGFPLLKRKALRKNRLRRFDELLELMETANSIERLSRKIHLKPKYTKEYLKVLLEKKLIIKQNHCFKTVVIMQKQGKNRTF